MINRGEAISVYDYWQLNKQKLALQKAYHDRWSKTKGASGKVVDLLLTPVMPHTALPHRGCRWVGYTKVWNFLDYTALAFPFGICMKERDFTDPSYQPRNELDSWNWSQYDPVSMNGHPVGLQIVGRRFEEEKVLGAVQQLNTLINKWEKLKDVTQITRNKSTMWTEVFGAFSN